MSNPPTPNRKKSRNLLTRKSSKEGRKKSKSLLALDTGQKGQVSVPPSKTPSNVNAVILQEQVDEVVDVMKDNVNKVIERDIALQNLDDRTAELEHNAGQFQKTAKTAKNAFWWKKTKLTLIIACIVLVIAGVLFVYLITLGPLSDLFGTESEDTTKATSSAPQARRRAATAEP